MVLPGISLEYTIKSRIKQFFCKQHIYKTITNFHGDAIHDMSRHHIKTIRSLLCCVNCGKLQPSEFLDENCKVVNFNLVKEENENESYRALDRS